MHGDHNKWSVRFQAPRSVVRTSRHSVAALSVLMCLTAVQINPVRGQGNGIEKILSQPLTDYDNAGKPLIPTLVDLAARYRLPMGIEKVTCVALQTPIQCQLKTGSLSDLLTACIEGLSGYHWAVQDGAVDVYGEEEWTSRMNLFNYVVPSLDVKGDLNFANALLRMSVPDEATPSPVKPRAVPGGNFGDSPGVGSLKPTQIDFEARQQTVRTILNRIVSLSNGEVIWIARVPPSALAHNPKQGLWLLVPLQSGAPPDLESISAQVCK
jgi:hypothetical protein